MDKLINWPGLGVVGVAEPLTLAAGVTRFVESMRGVKAAKTIAWYRDMLAGLVELGGEGLPLGDVSLSFLRSWRLALLERRRPNGSQLSPHTVNAHLRAAAGFFGWAEREGLVERSPARGLERVAVPKRPKRGVSEGDAQAIRAETESPAPEGWPELLAAYLAAGRRLVGSAAEQRALQVVLSNLRDRAIVLTLASTAARLGGVAGLRLDDLDLGARRAWVFEKGQKERPVFLTAEAALALADWLGVRPERAGDAVWVSLAQGPRFGDPLTASGISQVLRRLKKRAGVKGRVNAHAWRHFALRKLTEAGMPLGVVADIAGHSDVRVTHSFYGSFAADRLQAIFDRYGGALDGGSSAEGPSA